LLYWKKIERFLEKDLYDEFIELLKDTLQLSDPTILPFNNVIILLKEKKENPQILAFFEKLKNKQKTALFNLVFDDNYDKKRNSVFNVNRISSHLECRAGATINSAISQIVRLSGQIIIPIEDEKWITKLKNFQGVATILDGGIVTVNKLIPEYELTLDSIIGFLEIKNISSQLLNEK
jgi:hypothetical protein